MWRLSQTVRWALHPLYVEEVRPFPGPEACVLFEELRIWPFLRSFCLAFRAVLVAPFKRLPSLPAAGDPQMCGRVPPPSSSLAAWALSARATSSFLLLLLLVVLGRASYS